MEMDFGLETLSEKTTLDSVVPFISFAITVVV